jgi:SNF2 family DNA or RNA helicase
MDVIPSAKLLKHNGKEYVVVRHRVDEVKVLRNMGINAPSPINYYYKWPGRFAPFKAQKEAASFMTLNQRAFNLSDMGTGKTLATLWAYDYMRSIGKAHRMVVISPLSTLEQTWADEIFNHFPHLTYSVVYGDADKRLKLLNTDVNIYLINHDGIKIKKVFDELCIRDDIDLVVVDEISQMVRNAGTERYTALNRIINAKTKKNAWGLTGTPTPNAPTDAWAQCRIMVPHKVPLFFGKFKDSVMRKVSNFVWAAKDDAMDIVHEVMQPAIRFSRDECVDLPPCTFQMRKADMSTAQQKHFKEMMNALKTDVDNGEVTAVNEAIKAQKLIQIACGVVYGKGIDGNSTRLDIDAKARLEVVREIVEQAGTKVIVFVPFVSAVDKVAEHLRAAGFSAAVIHGGIKSEDRDAIFKAFQKTDAPKVIVAQPATISHGLTLTAASTIVWYAPITSADTFEQANARITRPGQRHNQLIVMIEGSQIERKYYERLKTKQKLQGVLLDLVKEGREIT